MIKRKRIPWGPWFSSGFIQTYIEPWSLLVWIFLIYIFYISWTLFLWQFFVWQSIKPFISVTKNINHHYKIIQWPLWQKTKTPLYTAKPAEIQHSLPVVLRWDYFAWKIATNNKALLVSILPLLASPQNLHGCFLGWALWLHSHLNNCWQLITNLAKCPRFQILWFLEISETWKPNEGKGGKKKKETFCGGILWQNSRTTCGLWS